MPNEWVYTLDTTNNQFLYTYTADEAKPSPTGYNLILSTQNTFVDKNIKIKTIIPAGSLSSGNTTVSASSNVTLLGSSQNSAPIGAYISVTGQGAVSVGTAGWIAADTSEDSTSKTIYYPLQSAQFNWGTGADANKVYCTTAGYTPANPSSAILTMTTTSVVQTNVTTVSGTTATGATATWGTGYITSGSIAAATFSNEPASGKTLASYVDISNTTAAPVLSAGDYLYINRGYVDNIVISLDKLVPNNATIAVVNEQSAHILSGYSAYDNRGHLIAGTIPTITLPSTTDGSATQNYTSQATIYATNVNQYLNLPSGYYNANKYYLIKAVTTNNISAANIKYGVTIKVGDSADDDRIATATGTFTGATTVSTGQTALTYDSTTHISDQMLENYSAWVNGLEIKGSIITKTSTDLTFDGGTRTFTTPAGYYASNATKQIDACSITPGNGAVDLTSDTGDLSIYSSTNTHGIGINDSAPASNSGKVYIKITANGKVTTGIGWNNTSTETSSNNKIRYISLNKYNGDYTTT